MTHAIIAAICKKCRSQHAAEVKRRTTTQSLQDDTFSGRSDSNNNQELGKFAHVFYSNVVINPSVVFQSVHLPYLI